MNNDPQDIGKFIQNLAIRSVNEQVRSLERLRELITRVARGELKEQTVLEEFTRFAHDETAHYIKNLATLSLSYYNDLLDQTRAHNDRFFDRVLGNTATSDMPASTTAHPQQVDVELRAPVGTDITRTFAIENKRIEIADISFLISEFVGPSGTAHFRPPLQIKPPRFRLGPREERVVTLVLPLLPELFTPGEHYIAKIVVRGYEDLELILNIWPEATVGTEQEELTISVAKSESDAASNTSPGGTSPKVRRLRKASGGSHQ